MLTNLTLNRWSQMSTWSALLFVDRFILSPAMTRKSVHAGRCREPKERKENLSKCCLFLPSPRQLVDRLRIFVIYATYLQYTYKTVQSQESQRQVRYLSATRTWRPSVLKPLFFFRLVFTCLNMVDGWLVCKCNVTVVFYYSTHVLTAFHCLPTLYAAIIYTIRVIFIANNQATTQQ